MYSFGQTLSLPFYTETWTPESWYDRLEENLRVGMHTLVLVDIKVREQSEENMARWVGESVSFCSYDIFLVEILFSTPTSLALERSCCLRL